jgi:hypothetical protein
MKHNLIKTDNYLLVFDKLSEIKEGDWYKTPLGIYSQFNGTEKLPIGTRRVASHAPLNGAPYLDGVDVLPPLPLNQTKYIKEYQQYPDGTHVCIAYSNGDWFCGLEGNEEAEKNADLILDKLNNLYTKEFLLSLIDEIGLVKTTPNELNSKDYQPFITDEDGVVWTINKEHLLQYIQQPKLPIAFECEMITRVYDVYPQRTERKLKTITNSEGRTEWVGKYIYE